MLRVFARIPKASAAAARAGFARAAADSSRDRGKTVGEEEIRAALAGSREELSAVEKALARAASSTAATAHTFAGLSAGLAFFAPASSAAMTGIVGFLSAGIWAIPRALRCASAENDFVDRVVKRGRAAELEPGKTDSALGAYGNFGIFGTTAYAMAAIAQRLLVDGTNATLALPLNSTVLGLWAAAAVGSLAVLPYSVAARASRRQLPAPPAVRTTVATFAALDAMLAVAMAVYC